MNTTILGTGSYLPDRVVTNAELAPRAGVDEQWIVDKTGIRTRRMAAPEQASSDLATEAARRALAAAGVDVADVGLIVLATSTADQPMPATACVVQANLGADRAVAFDVDAVCTGFVYALAVAHSMLAAGIARGHAVVIGVDTYSRILDYTDRRTAALFGDGAGAVVLGPTDGPSAIRSTTLGSDGNGADLVRIPGGGSRLPASHETVDAGRHYFLMAGREVRQIADKILTGLMVDVLADAGLTLSDVDLIVPHQANGHMLAGWSEELGLAPGVMHVTADRYGNTGAASVPVTLDDAVQKGLLRPGATVVLVALGGGVTWGGIVLRWPA